MASLQEALASRLHIATLQDVRTFTSAGITVTPSREHVIIFDVAIADVPEELHRSIIPAAGGASVAAKVPTERVVEKYRWAFIDASNFIAVCSVKSVHMSGLNSEYCRVYLNYEVNSKHLGFNFWAGYEDFLRSLFATAFETCKSRSDDAKISLLFAGGRSKKRSPETTIYFRAHT